MTDPALTTSPVRACRTQRVVLPGGERTWTVVDGEHRVVAAAEEYLEYLRMLGRSPNTVKSYARALALWWEFLDVYELAWDAVTIEDLGRFLGWLRSGDEPGLALIERRPARFSEGTVGCVCRRSARSIATTISMASRPLHACMSACSWAGLPTSRCSSISRAGEATTVVSCASRGRGRGRRRR